MDSYLGAVGSAGWPSNALLYLAVSADSAVFMDSPVATRFGLQLITQELPSVDAQLVRELLQARGAPSDETLVSGLVSKGQEQRLRSLRDVSRLVSRHVS